MTSRLEKILFDKFGYSTFRQGQKEIIQSVLNQEDVLAILPTGMGKSLCYQLPGYLLPYSVVIISPLLSLMQDQVDQLKQMGEKRVVAVNSFLTVHEKNDLLQKMETYKFIFLSPEMLMQEQVKAKLQTMPISLIVADEAHCISQWGFDFRPDYLRLSDWLSYRERPPILALTATATPKVINDITTQLKLQTPSFHIQSLDRPNIRYEAIEVDSQQHKFDLIASQINQFSGPGIIYTQSRRKADEYALKLSMSGIRIASYHAGMEQVDRMFIQQQFLNGEIEWVCATNAFGMGVHKNNVRQIIHDHFPSSVANYAQEVGRAGRDGLDSLATLFFTRDDEDHSIFVATNDFPDESHVRFYIDSKQNGQHAGQLVEMGILSETHVRILTYWLPRKSAEETITILHKLKQQKIAQIYLMKEIITNSSCIRQQIIEVFGQKLNERPSNCCTKCGLIKEEVVNYLTKQENQLIIQTWENRFSSLFQRHR